MTTMRKLGVALALLVTLLFAGTLYYFMPRATKVLITGTEVKRMDTKDPPTGEHRSRDVRFVYATDLVSRSDSQQSTKVFHTPSPRLPTNLEYHSAPKFNANCYLAFDDRLQIQNRVRESRCERFESRPFSSSIATAIRNTISPGFAS